jgi:hypothetical protein
MEIRATKRGLLRAEFKDRYGALCSVQESSIPGEDCLWLGVDINFEGDEVRHGRMHLTPDLARRLVPILRHFARRGTLGLDTVEDPYYVGAWVLGVGEDNRGIEGRVIEAHPGQTLTVQDSRRAGPEGQVICTWDVVNLIWDPMEVPESVQTRYDLLTQTDD